MARDAMYHGNTAKELEARGDWAKVDKKHYQNIDGVEVKFDCNCHIWRVNGGVGWSTLWAAVYEVDHNTWGGNSYVTHERTL